MGNNRNIYEEFQKKLFAQKLKDELSNAYEMMRSEQKQKEYNNEIARKTGQYQQKYGFETSQRQGHEYWNNEADAFKHAFGSADMYFKYGDFISTGAGIRHEWQTKNNPQNEWNMDSWNNNKGRDIAREIKKEYGDKFNDLPQQQRDDIIAEKVMEKMRNGDLITSPSDSRKYRGIFENAINGVKKQYEGLTGGAAPAKPYTREQIANMSSDEFSQHEAAIREQWGKMGIPSERDLPNEQKSSTKKSSSSSTNSADGKWVTINGKHVLIKN